MIYIIMGSVRTRRLCPDIAVWIAQLCQQVAPQTDVEIIDLRDWPLSGEGEPAIPAQGDYQTAGTRAWSEKIAQGDGFIFLTPQYNSGYPAALKNAIDHLYCEWQQRPAMIVTYGGHGGGKCAEQLNQVLSGLKMRLVPEMPGLTLPKSIITDNPGAIDAAALFGTARETICSAIIALLSLAAQPAD
ncbi:MAG: NADH-dependent flavin reductase subunit 2 [Candidatus Erwinia impunctatus]|nr:NADH-dependent flavin reductase subunit 2 [Culicoides impunctatus]